MSHQDVRDALLDRFAAIAALTTVLPQEPLLIPGKKLPCLTFKWLGMETVDFETGGGQDETHRWRLYLYVRARELGEAWDDVEEIVPALAAALRHDPTLDGLVDKLGFVTEGEPDIVERGAGGRTQLLGQQTSIVTAIYTAF